MRINQYIAKASTLSRRAADKALISGRVTVNNSPVETGYVLQDGDIVCLDGKILITPTKSRTILLHKPVGFVCSRNGQGSKTIYDLLPLELHTLKPVGRLDKNSSGLLLLTNDGYLANQLTHPKYAKIKIYDVTIDMALAPSDRLSITKGVKLEDGVSKLAIRPTNKGGRNWEITMYEGRNRQIRRTFGALGYKVLQLHRKQFGATALDDLPSGDWQDAKSML